MRKQWFEVEFSTDSRNWKMYGWECDTLQEAEKVKRNAETLITGVKFNYRIVKVVLTKKVVS